MESRTGFNYYYTDDDLLIQTIDGYDILLKVLPTGKTLALATDDDILIQTIDRYDIVLIALPTGKTLTLAPMIKDLN